MATATQEKRPSIGLTVLMAALLLVVGLFAFQWAISLFWSVVRTIMILIALYLVARIAWYLIRNGR